MTSRNHICVPSRPTEHKVERGKAKIPPGGYLESQKSHPHFHCWVPRSLHPGCERGSLPSPPLPASPTLPSLAEEQSLSASPGALSIVSAFTTGSGGGEDGRVRGRPSLGFLGAASFPPFALPWCCRSRCSRIHTSWTLA